MKHILILLIAISSISFSCNKIDTITYVVKSPHPTDIFYVNEFGTMSHHEMYNKEWKTQFKYIRDVYGPLNMCKVGAKAIDHYDNNFVTAQILINGKEVASVKDTSQVEAKYLFD